MANDERPTINVPSRRSWIQPVLPILLLLTGCTGLGSPASPPPQASPTTSPADIARSLNIRPGTKIGLNALALFGALVSNRVDPDQPDGGMLVTVLSWDAQEAVLDWQRTVREPVPGSTPPPTPVVGIGTPRPPAPTQAMLSVKQHGQLTVTGLDSSHRLLVPLYWAEFNTQTSDGSGLWLSREAYEELLATRQTRWTRDVMVRPLLSAENLHTIDQAISSQQILLSADDDFHTAEVAVDGTRVAVQTVVAHDNFGNEYHILANPDNPLILKFAYDAVGTNTIHLDDNVWAALKELGTGYQVLEITR